MISVKAAQSGSVLSMGTRSAASMPCLVPLESQAAQEGGLGGEDGEPHGRAPSDSGDVKGVNIGQTASCLSAQGSASIRAPILMEYSFRLASIRAPILMEYSFRKLLATISGTRGKATV